MSDHRALGARQTQRHLRGIYRYSHPLNRRRTSNVSSTLIAIDNLPRSAIHEDGDYTNIAVYSMDATVNPLE
jgi:hypothetical protein